jgi:hypothetical protein
MTKKGGREGRREGGKETLFNVFPLLIKSLKVHFRARRMAQLKYLPSKCKALSSTPSTTKKKKKVQFMEKGHYLLLW